MTGTRRAGRFPPGVNDSARRRKVNEVFVDGTAPVESAPAPGEIDPSSFVLDQVVDEAPPEVPARPDVNGDLNDDEELRDTEAAIE